MSKETMNWLNNNVLVGMTDLRGKAWHWLESEQGAESNHYPRAIPQEDVLRRLFDWEPLEGDVSTNILTPEGVTTVTDPTRKTIVNPRDLSIMGIFKQGYRVHGYAQWLLRNCELIMDNTGLQIASAGLLKNGAVGWVQYQLEEPQHAAGLEFRPFLLAATSFDGSLASTYLHGSQAVVCDNTLMGALGERDQQVKVRHSSKSLGKVEDVREALALFPGVGPLFVQQIEALAKVKVSDRIFTKFLDDLRVAPLVDRKTGDALTGKAKTMAETKRTQISNLWLHDERAATWHGTGLGAYMAVNTWTQHFQHVRNMSRPERNALNMVEGSVLGSDLDILAALATVTK